MTSYLPRFDAEFAPKLFKRAKTFRLMFELLDKNPKDSLVIVETGCIREEGCWEGDGQSTVVFHDYIKHRGNKASLISIDNNPEAIAVAEKIIEPNSYWMRICADSVPVLSGWSSSPLTPIDLLYLDSYDYNPGIEHESSLHCLKELAAAQKNLRPGSIICVDDNHPDGTGKGKYVRDYLHNIGIEPLMDDYQVVWVWK